MNFELSREQFRTMILTKIEGHSVKDICDGYRNKFDVQDAPRSGRPLTSATEQTIDAVLTIIEGDPHSTYQQIETILGISSTAINSTIHDYLNLRKRFEEGQSRRIFDVITGNESRFYHYDPELKEQSKVWMSTTDPRPTKVYRNKSAGKRMVAIFFVKSGLIKFVPLETGATVNATAERYPNPPYSPDLSPCDFFLFPKLKKQLRGIWFNDDNEMLTALEQAIDNLTKEHYKKCFEDWFIRMHKCIDANGQYFEKIN
ncbi:unnamed protein product [Rotaria magnacalcarata]|uniref:Transposase n=1 Tax=Rotaria magnacalcarata TaxID=392030 RepID=A0A815H0U8_9BILA|nr:unnamed protein product [Rotaria magnacalcarata]CAF3823142.1 unnamed protein product [Rotaria magnacalcarata]